MNDLKKEWNAIKPDWVYESPKDANHHHSTRNKYIIAKNKIK